MPKPVDIDGNIDFSGGMDTSRQIHILDPNQYARACNVSIPRNGSRIKQRFGIHHQVLLGDSNAVKAYKNGKNFQGEGYYEDHNETVLIRVVDGLVIQLKKYATGCYKVAVLNRNDRNNPKRSKCWVVTIPGGVIIQDGESLPLIVTNSGIRRSDPSAGEIGVGRMGVFLQNRYFYVTSKENFIQASDFSKPLELKNSVATNVHGFITPNERPVTAIGAQKALLNYAEGGVLSFSTIDNVYSVDVRGDRQDWEATQTNLGKVQESLPGIGAISSYSYEPFNANLWFRTVDFGLMNFKRSEFQFTRDDDYSSQSIEVDYWLGNDSEILLDKCYTRSYRNRLLTTVGPAINKYGYTYWNGLISMNPDPDYRGEKRNRRFEGLITGVRPWMMTSVSSKGSTELFIDSFDVDGVSRLYKIEDGFDYDINHLGDKVEIESWIETRGFTHGAYTLLKNPTRRYYFIQDLTRTLKVEAFTRSDSCDQWIKFFNTTHRVKSCCMETLPNGSTKFSPIDAKPQCRQKVNLTAEPKGDCSSTYGTPDGRKYYVRQDRFEFKGPFSLASYFREAEDVEDSKKDYAEETKDKMLAYVHRKDYVYNIAQPT